jgi:hypothetical protein
MAPEYVCDLAISGDECCRAERVRGDYPVELLKLVCE